MVDSKSAQMMLQNSLAWLMRPTVTAMALLAAVTVTFSQTMPTAPDGLVVIEANSPVLRQAQVAESIGLETLGGVFIPLLKAGCSLPCEATNKFSTADDKQTEIAISLFRGAGTLVSENHLRAFRHTWNSSIATGKTRYCSDASCY